VKKIEAIVAPEILDAVKGVLNEHGCHEIVLSEVRISRPGDSSAAGHYRGNSCEIDLPKLKLEAIVRDAAAMPLAQAILHISRTQLNAHADISFCSLDQVVSIGISAVQSNEPGDLRDFTKTQPRLSSNTERLHA
jgi:nitrogen regulatory protein PII